VEQCRWQPGCAKKINKTASRITDRIFPLNFPSLYAMVRLITHNLLACHVKGCTTNNFPLKLTNIELALREAEFNPDFLRGFLPRIEWDALIQASREVSNTPLFHMDSAKWIVIIYMYKVGDTSLPVERPEMLDDDLLRHLHHVLLEVSQQAFNTISII
jgi:multifunctional methyltransferase subunit TRM112